MPRSTSTCWDAPATSDSGESPRTPETFASPSVTGGEAVQGVSAEAKDSTST